MSVPHVQLILDRDIEPPGPLRVALDRVQAQVSIRSLDKAIAEGVSPTADLCVVLPSADRPTDVLDAMLARASDRTCSTMLIPSDQSSAADRPDDGTLSEHRLNPLGQRGSNGLNADELTGRIRALCEIRHPLRRMREELNRMRDNLRDGRGPQPHGWTDLDEQIRLAGQIQYDLLPEPLAGAAPLAIEALYLPADFVSGDTYDIHRLDEERFGFSLADATGHGLPAALLAILVKNSLRGKEIYNGSYRIIEPDELLSRLNQDLLATNLRQCHFITALHAIFDRTNHELRWARGGIPYPILFRPGQPPRQIRSAGSLVGAFENQMFEVVRLTLQPGDVMLLFTDGLEALLLGRSDQGGDDAILRTDWVRQFADLGPQAALQQIRELAGRRDPAEWSRDDITALTISMT